MLLILERHLTLLETLDFPADYDENSTGLKRIQIPRL